MTEITNKEKIASLKKQIRAMQEQRIKIENFDKKAKKSTQRWTQEIKHARKLAQPNEILSATDNVRVRVETAENKLKDFSNNQNLLRLNYKEMTEAVYSLFKEMESILPLDEKSKIEKQIQYCINF